MEIELHIGTRYQNGNTHWTSELHIITIHPLDTTPRPYNRYHNKTTHRPQRLFGTASAANHEDSMT